MCDLTLSGNSIVGHGNCLAIASCDAAGGAVYIDATTVNVTNCNFTGNSVTNSASNSVRLFHVDTLCF
jgi:hypothetical protein